MAEESFNASVYLVDRQVAAGRGDHLAVAGPAGSLTYAELADPVAALAAGLLGLGIRPEERVLLVMSAPPRPCTSSSRTPLVRCSAATTA